MKHIPTLQNTDDLNSKQGPIPVTILVGFLGAGKTTLLNQMLHGQHGRRLAVVINDFGKINIDAELISEVEEGMVSLTNGCVCCTIRLDLIGSVLQLAARPERPDQIIIEASGVSDPAGIVNSFLGTEIWDKVILDGVIAVVDGEQVLTLPKEETQLTEAQVSGADLILLNKVDLVDAITLAEVHSWISDHAPGIQVFETKNCQLPIEVLLGTETSKLNQTFSPGVLENHIHKTISSQANHPEDHPHNHSLTFDTWSYCCDRPLRLDLVQQVLSRLPNTVFRVKGFINSKNNPEKRLVFQMVGRRATLTVGESWKDEKPKTRLVFISCHTKINTNALEIALNNCQVQE